MLIFRLHIRYFFEMADQAVINRRKKLFRSMDLQICKSQFFDIYCGEFPVIHVDLRVSDDNFALDLC